MSEFTFEPELLETAPRRVKFRDGYKAGCGMWGIRIIMLPHTIIGVGFLVLAVGTTLQFFAVALLGTNCEGKIVKKDDSRSVKKSPRYYLLYEFTLDERIHTGEVQVDVEQFRAVNEGDPISVRAWDVLPDRGQWPRVSGHWQILSIGETWIPALFWNGVLSFFIWHMYVRPWRQRCLVRSGVPTAGIVRRVTEQQHKGSKSYRIEYEYAAIPLDDTVSRTFKGRTTSTVKGAELAKEGDLITILYFPNKPHRSVAYRYADYRAAS